MNDELISATERVAVVVMVLAQGNTMTTRDVSERTGLTISGAHRMLLRISAVVPLARTDGAWYLLDAHSSAHQPPHTIRNN